jgi:hypothetical protein
MPRPKATVVAAMLAVEEGEEGVVEGVFEAPMDVVGVMAAAGLRWDQWFEEAEAGLRDGVFDDGSLKGRKESWAGLAFEVGLDGDAGELLLVGEGALGWDNARSGLEDEDGSELWKRASEGFELEFEGDKSRLAQEDDISARARCLLATARWWSSGQDGGKRSTYQRNCS